MAESRRCDVHLSATRDLSHATAKLAYRAQARRPRGGRPFTQAMQNRSDRGLLASNHHESVDRFNVDRLRHAVGPHDLDALHRLLWPQPKAQGSLPR